MNIPLRIIYGFMLAVIIFAGPWWMAVVLLGIGILVFPFYLEAVLLAVLFEALFAPDRGISYTLVTLGAVAAVFIVLVARRFIRTSYA